ncbi:MAG: hypothetical protein QOJ96_976 [Alphaproteobacteria bacterium]|nr:hypothetical protein [Alphaproteobacteria bacterium]
MRSINACLVAFLAAILSIGSPAAASNACNAGQSMCRVEADSPVRLAANHSAKCKCETGGRPGFPCRFLPAHFPVGESGNCR